MKWVGLIITPPQYETALPHPRCVCVCPIICQYSGSFQSAPSAWRCSTERRRCLLAGGTRRSAKWWAPGELSLVHTGHCSPLIGRQARTCRHLVEGGAADPRQHLHQRKIHWSESSDNIAAMLNPSFSTCQQILSALIITPCHETLWSPL